MVIALIIVMFFTISSVCAVDNEIQDIGAHNSTDTVSVSDDDNLKMDDANELAETDDSDDLNQTINGDSSKTYIELEKDYHGYYGEGYGIQINRDNVVIDGKGHTIDCTDENSRMFNVRADNITLKNIVFIGGRSDYGGAVNTWGYLKVINCTFKDNRATGIGQGHGGGAIFADNAKLSIYDCTFINNHASKDGGAITAGGYPPKDCEIFNCTF